MRTSALVRFALSRQARARPGPLYETLGGVDATGSDNLAQHLPPWAKSRPGPSGFSSTHTAEEVTGGNSGLGRETCRVLMRRGCEIIMAGRNAHDMDRQARWLREQARHPAANVTPMQLDLSSLASVSAFAQAFLSTGKPLNFLHLNAGIMGVPFMPTKDGHEMQFQVNYLGHFLLTQLLLKHMEDTAKQQGVTGRVIAMSSGAHTFMGYLDQGIRFDKLDSPEGYNRFKSYGQSKLCQLLFMRELHQRLRQRGSEILTAAVDPGTTITDITQYFLPLWLYRSVMVPMSLPFVKTVPLGAATQVYCITNPGVVSGEYYVDCNVAASHPWGANRALGEKLWSVSEHMCRGYLRREEEGTAAADGAGEAAAAVGGAAAAG